MDIRVKMGTKKGRSNDVLQPFRVSLFSRFYARLISDAITPVSVFFKTITLSGERWHFSAPFQISKNSISATFSTRFPSACPPPMIGASFAHNVPTQIPCASPVFCSFRGNLRKRIPTQIPAHSPSNPPFQGEPTVDFLEKTVIFLEFDTF